MTSFKTLMIAGAGIALIGAGVTVSSANTETANAASIIATAQTGAEINAPYNAFLTKYLRSVDGINMVRYGSVTAKDKAALKAYVASLEGLKPSTMTKDEQLAFWFNLYNAKTVEIILDNYPVSSIRQIGGGFIAKGPWKEQVVTVEQQRMSLDNIEHDTVRRKFDEPRVHYAFNCASIGCPNLSTAAWTAEGLDAQLNAAARDFINHPRGVRVENNGDIVASSIYKWFRKDFGQNDKDILTHLQKYASGKKLDALNNATRITSYQYDWDLNEAK